MPSSHGLQCPSVCSVTELFRIHRVVTLLALTHLLSIYLSRGAMSDGTYTLCFLPTVQRASQCVLQASSPRAPE